MPGQEFIDATVGMACGDGFKGTLEPGVGLDAVQFLPFLLLTAKSRNGAQIANLIQARVSYFIHYFIYLQGDIRISHRNSEHLLSFSMSHASHGRARRESGNPAGLRLGVPSDGLPSHEPGDIHGRIEDPGNKPDQTPRPGR